jgi:hypothetical protein
VEATDDTIRAPSFAAQDFADAIRHQLPRLSTRGELRTYLADYRTRRTLNWLAREHRELHAELDTLIGAALELAVDDDTQDQEDEP